MSAGPQDRVMAKLTETMDQLDPSSVGGEKGESPEDRLARSLQKKKDKELLAFINKGSSLQGWSDSKGETTEPRVETVRVTGFNIAEASPTLSPLIGSRIKTPGDVTPIEDPLPQKEPEVAQNPRPENQAKPHTRVTGPGTPSKLSKKKKKKQKQKPPKPQKAPERRQEPKSKYKHHVSMQYDDPKRLAKMKKHQVLDRTPVERQKRVPLFSHLAQYEGHHVVSMQVGLSKEGIHPSILRLGVKFAEGAIVGSNARCMAMLCALKDAIKDFRANEEKEMKRDLMDMLKPIIRFALDECRPKSLGMGNAIRYVKHAINSLPANRDLDGCKSDLLSDIDHFIKKHIVAADMEIAKIGSQRIEDGDVIMTYARSHVVEMLLVEAHKKFQSNGEKGAKKGFRVVIVDSRPKYEGKVLCKRLADQGISCTYCLLNGLSYVMKEVTKVLVGASSILSNGAVLSRVGTATVCLMANVYKKPVMVACEVYKFSERVQVSSISSNELGDPEDLVRIDTESRGNKKSTDSPLANWRQTEGLKILNLVYDLTPASFVDMVITEIGPLPVTSVPVVRREYIKTLGTG
eukprot:CAMPEP_0114531804 /NCGR_PEP_ID=MMETSP0109-20121206/26269_1 /TAXON_ID=29199 /ORGANISM="Chlorarachnion reptans, Strain CCCM449" /LENGTH=574 /DNA_ID=CAMNT_0001714709 /DNA_START=133 /DNA_END=1857 /DNA_ORIENTATION=-